MRSRAQNLWDNVQSSLWFIPTVLVLLAMLLSSLLVELDVVLAQRQSKIVPWLFSGTADAARTVLSVVAGSLITVISIAISLTILALVQASAQFTPRVLRQFTSSRPNQVVLGTYTATFMYALLVLRTVRSAEQGNPFVPALSVTVAVGLALVCLGLLIFFIHHMSQALQVAIILDQVRHELIEQIDDVYPHRIGDGVPDPPPTADLVQRLERGGKPVVIRSERAGFVRTFDEQTLRKIPFGSTKWLLIHPQIGEFVAVGSIIAELDHIDSDSDDVIIQIRKAFVIDRERTINQDPLFGIRQLVDIGLKALSPGINDMTTAEYALYHLGDALGRLAERSFPSNVRTIGDGQMLLIVTRPTWDGFVDAAFSQIRYAGSHDVHVTSTLLHVLHDLALRLPRGPRTAAVHRQVAAVRYQVEQSSWSAVDQMALHELADRVEYTLRSKSIMLQES